MSDTTGLSKSLFSAAADFAQSGLRARLNDEPMVYLLHIGTALELLLKAYLASLHGTLIVENNDFDALLRASGHATHARKAPGEMRTITVTKALDRVGQLLPQIEHLKPQLAALANARNGVVHIGLATIDVDNVFLVPFLRAGDQLAGQVATGKRDDLWGEFIAVVDAYISESTEAAKVSAAEALAVANQEYDHRYGSMGPDIRDGVIKVIEAGYNPERYEEDVTECPACGHKAIAHGAFTVEWKADWDGDGDEYYPSHAWPEVTFLPGSLSCRVCGLELENEDELRVAGVEPSWVLEDVDASDFYEDPTDDDYR